MSKGFRKRAAHTAPGLPPAKVPEAKAYFTKRGIDLAYAAEAGITAIPESAAKEVDEQHHGGDVIQIPYLGIDGSVLEDGGQPFIRSRRLAAFGDSKFKQPPHTRNHLYLAPLRLRQKGKGKYMWKDVAVDTDIPILVAEGEAKALSIGQHGKAAIATGGINNFMTKANPQKEDSERIFLPDFSWIKWAGRKVYLVPDHDVPVRPELRVQLGKLARTFAAVGANVFIIELPNLGDGKTGADDFIKAHGFPAFWDLPRYKLTNPRYRDLAPDTLPTSFTFKPLPDDWFTKRLPPIEYLVDGLIPRNTVALGIAAGGVGKTYLGLQIAVSVSTGDPFLGRPTKQGRVLFVAMEDSIDILRRRVDTIVGNITATMPKPKADAFRALARHNLNIISLVGQQFHLVTLDHGTAVQSAALLRFIGEIRDQNYLLVVLDPLSRLHGADENGNQTGTALVNAGERIKEETGCNVLITHHTGKQATKRTDAYAARGASAIADAARVVMVITTLSPDECAKVGVTDPDQVQRGVLQLTPAKISYAQLPRPMYLKRQEDGDLRQFAPDFSADHPDTLLEALRKYCDKHQVGVSLRTAREDLRVKIFGSGVSKRTVASWFKTAVDSGVLELSGRNKSGNADLYRPAAEAADE